MGRNFLASLAFCSRCCCCNWLNEMPSLAAWARRSAQSVSGGFSGASFASSSIVAILRPAVAGTAVEAVTQYTQSCSASAYEKELK
jgi:hypothetical protein